MRSLRHEVRRRWRDDDEIALTGQADVADVEFLRLIEEIGEHAFAGNGARRQRRHELLRRLGHHHTHRYALLAQPADEVEALIGGDAAADDQQNPLHGAVPAGVSGAGVAKSALMSTRGRGCASG